MLEISNLALPLDAGLEGKQAEKLVRRAAARALNIPPNDITQIRLLKRSVDARKKHDVHFVATLGVELVGGAQAEAAAIEAAAHRKSATNVKAHRPYEPLQVPQVGDSPQAQNEPRPIVVGTGPAGLFCALYLARAGLRPLVVERGAAVDERMAAVDAFNAGEPLDPHTNIQYGEGGAGTFSDGKLTTNIKSPWAQHVLHLFVEAGAPEEILWQAKPHIGTDLLVDIVRNMRKQIEQAGGEVRFNTQLTALHFENGCLAQAEITRFAAQSETATEMIPASRLVLACGHSARDTFELVRDAGVHMEQKPFSVGVRIEHPQQLINRSQYGKAADHPALGAADYKLSMHLRPQKGQEQGRGVYTFCMCPGGEVVCAASEPEGVVVNGMSRFARDGQNANSALLVGVGPEDFDGEDPLAGIKLQREMERAAYRTAIAAGGEPYQAPAQTVGDFLAHRAGDQSKQVKPTYARGVAWCDLHECLPPFVARAMEQALPQLDRRLHGFADPQAVLTGVETRSSSPVRIVRGKNMQAQLAATSVSDCAQAETGPQVQTQVQTTPESPAASNTRPADAAAPEPETGLYPCGEGAGYAGGIMSAACDGLRVASALVESLRPE
ncbi:NAD(P)/FAD-dependent oxidoreductase [uncultured Senegalimassilia sp.]|uniref:NAD(P)/FAD-dependent oxidoreductase n=1 Tax=uncultured Senegalimassilia sp. TaxID=1714350 RepID=UPI0025E57321|nr:FAD-binding protein [uncultured Senegalimassilia sp.]